MRVFFEYVLPLLLPSLAFIGYVLVISREGNSAAVIARLRDGPWFWLIVAGSVLVMAAFTLTAVYEGAKPDRTYHAPRYEDGKVIPGGFD